MKTNKEANVKINESIEKLIEELKKGNTERFEEYLKFCSQFYRYSAKNRMLIYAQMPRASRIAGFNEWKRLGYKIKKGSKSIKIFAPSKFKYIEDNRGRKIPVKKATKEQKKKIKSGELEVKKEDCFILVSVFDISQTEKLKGNDNIDSIFYQIEGDNQGIYEKLKNKMEEENIKVKEVETIASDPGIQRASFGGRVEIKKSLASTNKVLTLIHEWSHEILHKGSERKNLTKVEKECQAEATSYIVANYLGIENPFSRDYILGWGGNDIKQFKTNLDKIIKASQKIIKSIESLKKEKVA